MHDSGEVVELRPNFRTAYAGLGAEDHYLARGCKQMWQHYLKPCSAALVMHTAETRLIQRVLNQVEKEEKLAPHIKHLLGGAFHFAPQARLSAQRHQQPGDLCRELA